MDKLTNNDVRVRARVCVYFAEPWIAPYAAYSMKTKRLMIFARS